MNGNDFLNAMTDVDDKHIIRAEKGPSKRRGLFIVAMSTAAAVVIAVTAIGVNSHFGGNNISTNQPGTNSTADLNGDITNGAFDTRKPRNDIVFPSISNNPTSNGELSPISPKYQTFPSGMGGGGYEEVKSDESTLWNLEMNFETLPVFRSLPTNSDYDFMMETLKCVVETFGYDFSEMTITDDFITKEKEQSMRERYRGYGASEEEVERMIGISKLIGSEISVRYDEGFISFTVSINLRYEVEIRWHNTEPNGSSLDCGFTLPNAFKPKSNTSSEMETAGRYMLETFSNMFKIENPEVDNTLHEFDYVKFYESGTDTEKFVNYQMNNAEFRFNDNGDIFLIKFNVPGGIEKVGDYPIISLDKAKERLYNNIYTTRSGDRDYKFTGTEPIGDVDLVYLTHSFWGYDIPYYCFYVKSLVNDIESYYDYYVPAIADEFLLPY